MIESVELGVIFIEDGLILIERDGGEPFHQIAHSHRLDIGPRHDGRIPSLAQRWALHFGTNTPRSSRERHIPASPDCG